MTFKNLEHDGNEDFTGLKVTNVRGVKIKEMLEDVAKADDEEELIEQLQEEYMNSEAVWDDNGF